MRGSTLVTGGSDGSVRVWSLDTYSPIHRLAAHDNSVTSLQFDDTRIVSGGSDGRVKIWDLNAGTLTRELSQPAEAVWRVAFEEERSVVLASRQGRTVMEVWDFSPPEEMEGSGNNSWSRPLSGTSRPESGVGGGLVEDAVMEDITTTMSSQNAAGAGLSQARVDELRNAYIKQIEAEEAHDHRARENAAAGSASSSGAKPAAERADSEMPDARN